MKLRLFIYPINISKCLLLSIFSRVHASIIFVQSWLWWQRAEARSWSDVIGSFGIRPRLAEQFILNSSPR